MAEFKDYLAGRQEQPHAQTILAGLITAALGIAAVLAFVALASLDAYRGRTIAVPSPGPDASPRH
ncbi:MULTISPECIES: hypothetical protein [unclassified Streptomyces]|uniref:hypothetical protein n=1 Tax=unclassified Streptomyces TaxID=2593676 RepID=UPI0038182DDA